MAIFLAGKAVCYRILAFFCYGKLHFKCESADLCFAGEDSGCLRTVGCYMVARFKCGFFSRVQLD